MVQESDWETADQNEQSWAYGDREDHEAGGISNRDDLGADDEDVNMNGDDRGGECSLC